MVEDKSNRKLRANSRIGKVLVVLGLVALILGGVAAALTVSGVGWKSVDDAIVVDAGSKDDYSCNSKNECSSKVYYQPTVVYIVNGDQHRYTAEHRTSQEYGPGDVVKVYYKASDPSVARFADVDNTIQIWQVVVMMAGAVITALGIWQTKRAKRIM